MSPRPCSDEAKPHSSSPQNLTQPTGFGEEGPEAFRAGSDVVAQAYSGLMVTDGKTDEDGAPDLISTPVADYTTGFAAAMGVVAALYHRERTGEGQYIATSLLRSGLFLQSAAVMREPVHDAVLRDPLIERVEAAREAGRSYDEIPRDAKERPRRARRLPPLLRRLPREGWRDRPRRADQGEPRRHASAYSAWRVNTPTIPTMTHATRRTRRAPSNGSGSFASASSLRAPTSGSRSLTQRACRSRLYSSRSGSQTTHRSTPMA